MTDTQPPKLSTLSPETRRILCAEILGWIDIKPPAHRLAQIWGRSSVHRTTFNHLPDPDLNANDALALVDYMRALGWSYQTGDVNDTDHAEAPHYCLFEKVGFIEAFEPTFQHALTSAFLLATNKAQP